MNEGRGWRLVLALVLGWAAVQRVPAADNVAVRVVAYEPGSGVVGAEDPTPALGEGSRTTVDPKWGAFPVDPFSPPYLTNQVVSIGQGGFLTLEFERPVLDDPSHPFGLDFLVFGNAFLQLNGDWATASGALGGTNKGITRVSVSADGDRFYRLDPAKAPLPDGWYPTDGAGDFSKPVDPAVLPSAFAGKDLAGVRALYAGSAGGAGYDLAWAVDAQGSNVVLQAMRFVRFEQETGVAEFDAVTAVGQPVAWAQDFGSDPAAAGWAGWGEPGLFAWHTNGGWLDVTWDSRKTNSYYFHPLGTVLSRQDDFAVMFDLRLDEVTMGIDPTKPGMFQLAVGLLGWEAATRTNFSRGAGVSAAMGPRNTLEFDYFPDTGFGATVSPTIVSSNNAFASEFVFPLELPLARWLRVGMFYTAADGVLRTRITDGTGALASVKDVNLAAQGGAFDFRLDTVAVCSFSDAGQDPQYGGSILARGAVDNVLVSLPRPAVERVAVHPVSGEAAMAVTLEPQPGWRYSLLRSTDLVRWISVVEATAGSRAAMELKDAAPPAEHAYYRVVAERP